MVVFECLRWSIFIIVLVLFRSDTIIAVFEWVYREKLKVILFLDRVDLEVMRKSYISRARGRLGGRPKVLDQEKISIAQALYDDGKTSVEKICSTFVLLLEFQEPHFTAM